MAVHSVGSIHSAVPTTTTTTTTTRPQSASSPSALPASSATADDYQRRLDPAALARPANSGSLGLPLEYGEPVKRNVAFEAQYAAAMDALASRKERALQEAVTAELSPTWMIQGQSGDAYALSFTTASPAEQQEMLASLTPEELASLGHRLTALFEDSFDAGVKQGAASSLLRAACYAMDHCPSAAGELWRHTAACFCQATPGAQQALLSSLDPEGVNSLSLAVCTWSADAGIDTRRATDALFAVASYVSGHPGMSSVAEAVWCRTAAWFADSPRAEQDRLLASMDQPAREWLIKGMRATLLNAGAPDTFSHAIAFALVKGDGESRARILAATQPSEWPAIAGHLEEMASAAAAAGDTELFYEVRAAQLALASHAAQAGRPFYADEFSEQERANWEAAMRMFQEILRAHNETSGLPPIP